ncbi:tRNA (adenosine(37)-N6)-dimethylallyltransferase MiaA [Thalassoroseus pseudoceratinae]|uniref:tRNA (adenosine(37)-N6)-dimethylallyltransferase MiaA n=1 Tax=Thalassoroseus pseudoceratinae TaxID=2713176 RepID=UPI0014207B6E|nr:tRNA (adenosine(37)-N6)-dimethylallyltransferase MiaA [Thalassoroseus pseudoceratinae]
MHIDISILRSAWFLGGPTASGKSEVAIHLAHRINAEIVAMDSMSLYRGMDIGTAKATPEQQAAVPHHLIDILEPHEDYSLAEYVTAADRVCREIVARDRVPLFVGGTGLYLRGLLRGVFDGPAANLEFRQRIETQAAQEDPQWLHRELAKVDPESAAKLHPNDARRLVRALEVHHVTGQPLSQQQRQAALAPEDRPRHVFWLEPPREWLHSRINRRVEAMIAEGLIEEVRGLLDRTPPISHTAAQALGYKEAIAHIHGEQSLDETIDLIQRRTRQFAKRQHTWFRNLEECIAVPINGQDTAEELANRIASLSSVSEH